MSHIIAVSSQTVTFIATVTNAEELTLLRLTTYLNVLVLFLAYSDPDKIFTRTRLVRCLAAVDFFGALLGLFSPNCSSTLVKHGCNVLAPYEITLLAFEMLAYKANEYTLLKFTTGRSASTLGKESIFKHCLALLLSLGLVLISIPVDPTIPLVFCSIIQNTQLRVVFFLLDGLVVYVAEIMARDDGNQGEIMWNV